MTVYVVKGGIVGDWELVVLVDRSNSKGPAAHLYGNTRLMVR